jgi:hypothetical protein
MFSTYTMIFSIRFCTESSTLGIISQAVQEYRPTAHVGGLVGEPVNETEKAPHRDGGSFAARTTKSACTSRSILKGHCWANFMNARL